ncbi:MAG: response regulator [Pseudomonadota bacterium]
MKTLIGIRDPILAKIISSTFDEIGHRYTVANTRQEAFDTFAQDPFIGMIVLDSNITGLYYQNIPMFKSNGRPLYPYLIVITASETKEKITALNIGADAVIALDTFNVPELRAQIIAGARIVQRQSVHTNSMHDLLLTRSPHELPSFQPRKALERIDGDTTILKGALALFQKELHSTFEGLQSFNNIVPHPALARELYCLKLAASTVCATAIHAQIETLEMIAQSGNGQAFASNLASLEKEIERFRESARSGELEKDSFSFENANPLAGKTALVVDDNTTNSLILFELLKRTGMKVHLAQSGIQALDTFEKVKPIDLVIMDMQMPGIDGFEATRRIRALDSNIPVIAHTAMAMKGDKERCMAAGCNGYLPKPLERSELIQLCSDLLNQQATQAKKSQRKGAPIADIQALLAEDEPVCRYIIKEILEKEGFQIITVSAAKSSTSFKNKFDLLITDKNSLKEETKLMLGRLQEVDYSLPIAFLGFSSQTEFMPCTQYFGRHSSIELPIEKASLLNALYDLSPSIRKHRRCLDGVELSKGLDEVEKKKHFIGCDKPCAQLAYWQRSYKKAGGDILFCSKFSQHGRCGILLADVAGHDLKSSYVSHRLSGMVQAIWPVNQEPIKLLKKLHAQFKAQFEDSRFTCALCLLWDRERGIMRYANAGIPSACIASSKSSAIQWLHWKGTPIGMLDTADFDKGQLDFKNGSRLLLMTDGFSEHTDLDILAKLWSENTSNALPEATIRIADYVKRSSQFNDDMTLVAIESGPIALPQGGLRLSFLSTFLEVDAAMKKTDSYIKGHIPANIDSSLISLAIREALLNSVEHGNSRIESKHVDVDLSVKGSKLVAIISDEGDGFDWEEAINAAATRDSLGTKGGRGVNIIQQVSHSVSTAEGSLKIVFSLGRS